MSGYFPGGLPGGGGDGGDADTLQGETAAQLKDRANHTGTQTAATISDFDTEVGNNPDVAANTAHKNTVTGNPHAVTKTEVGLGNVTNDAQIPTAEKGVANGVATLDAGSKLPSSQLPSSAIEFKGTWNASTNTPTLADGVGTSGDQYKVAVAGTQDLGSGSITFNIGDNAFYNGTIWEKVDHTDAVGSVFGRIGLVIAALGDYALSLITNDSSAPGATAKDALDGHETRIAANDAKVSADGTVASHSDVSAAQATAIGNLSGINSGDGIQLDRFNALDALLVGSAVPTFESRNGHPVLSFDDSVDEAVMFNSTMSNDYSNGNLTVDIDWVAKSAIINDVKWDVAFEKIPGQDIDSDSFAAIQTGTDTTNGTSGILTRTSIAFTQAQADSIAAGEAYRLKVTRDANAGGDTMVGDAQLLRVTLRQ